MPASGAPRSPGCVTAAAKDPPRHGGPRKRARGRGGAVRPDHAGPVGGSVVPQPSVVVEHISFVLCLGVHVYKMGRQRLTSASYRSRSVNQCKLFGIASV